METWPPWLRYLVVLVGLALIAYEAFGYRGDPRYHLVVLYTAMIGLPSVLGQGRDGPPPPPPTLGRRLPDRRRSPWQR